MRKIFFALFIAVDLVTFAKGPITVSQKEVSDNPEIAGLLGVLGAYQTTATVYADTIDAKYFEIWMSVCNGTETKRTTISYVPIQRDSTQIVVTALPKDSMTVAIYVNGAYMLVQDVHIPTYQHLLIGCEFNWEFNDTDTIPLLAYSTGIQGNIKINGEVYERYDICGLRYSKVHPSEWKEKYNLRGYIYFEAIPVKKIRY